MHTAVRSTSRLAYKEEMESGYIHNLKARVYGVIASDSSTIREIAERLEKSPNVISPRVMELRTEGMVISAGKRKCEVSGKLAYAWKINNGELF